MLTIESWPEEPLSRAPRVRASADPGILVDLTQPDLDMLIWARRVPDAWQTALGSTPLPEEGLTVMGSLDEVSTALKNTPLRTRFPEFLLEDVTQTAALTAALALSDMLTVSFGPLGGLVWPETPQKLTTACCYGGALDWTSGLAPVGALTSSVSPYALAFLPAMVEGESSPLRFVPLSGPAIGLTVAAR